MGVPIEIDRALSQGKWVAVVSDLDTWMLQDKRRGIKWFPLAEDSALAAAQWLAGHDGPPYDDPPQAVLAVRRLEEHAVLPQRGYRDDAGLDLVVSAATAVPPRSSVDVPNGVAVELPLWAFGMIVGRSSTRRSKGLFIHTAIIDTGWRGEMFALVENVTDETVQVEQGDRIAQLIVLRNETMRLDVVERQTLSEHERGTNGFGSTGR
jgi:dUTP pyrophosphatase